MIIKEVKVESSFGGVISTANYENTRFSYRDSYVVDLHEGENEVEVVEQLRRKLVQSQKTAAVTLENRERAEVIKKMYENIRFREKDGKQYPSVTSILGWAKDFHISDIDLQQYAARGTIIHYMIEKFIETGSWLTLAEVAENGYKEEATIMFRGGLGLKIEDCTHEQFFEEFGNDFEFEQMEVGIFNEQYLYCGRLDAIGTYKGKRSIIDFKTGSSFEIAQLAAYANGDGIEGIEQLVICPVGPNKNKSGVKKPVVTKNIPGEFANFLKARSEFKKQFGI